MQRALVYTVLNYAAVTYFCSNLLFVVPFQSRGNKRRSQYNNDVYGDND